MPHSFRAVIATTLIAFSFNSFTATSQTDFSGTWTYRDQQRISGNLYSNGSPKQISVTQTAHSLIIEKTTAGEDGKELTSTDTLRFDGIVFRSVTTSGRIKETTLQWNADKRRFTTVAISLNPTDKSKTDFKTTDTWAIEHDQPVLQRKAENFGNGEVWESWAWMKKINRSLSFSV